MRLPHPPRTLAVAGLACVFLSVGCVRTSSRRSEAPPAPVVVTTAYLKNVPVQVRTIGTVKSVSTYLVKPRVGGELTHVHFNEGEDVKKGQKLFTIDPRQYENAVDRASATLDKDKALLGGAQLDLERVLRAVRSGVASREDLDEAQTKVASAKASVAGDEAALHAAKLQLSFTTITSPIDGRTGEVHVTTGNLVSPTDAAPLAEVVQIAPIDVVFALPEQLLPQVDEARKHGPLKVMVTPRNGEAPVYGKLAFSDNLVDTTTGTIHLKAYFTNEDRKLWPGQFVDVVLTTGLRPDSVVVPTSAIQSGQSGPYVYLVNKEGKAEIRYVDLAFQEEGEAVIAKGLQAGEKVVIEGQVRLAPGVKVDVKQTLPPPKAVESPDVAARNTDPEKPSGRQEHPASSSLFPAMAPAPRLMEGLAQ